MILDMMTSIPDWLGTLPDWLSGGAAVAALGLAYASISREEDRAEERREAVDGRVGGYALALNRQVRKWLDGWGNIRNHYSMAQWLSSQFDDAEERVERMIHFAPEGSAHVASTAQQAAEKFWKAADLVNDVLAKDRSLTPLDMDDFPEAMDRAHKDFRECSRLLSEIVEATFPEAPERPGLARPPGVSPGRVPASQDSESD